MFWRYNVYTILWGILILLLSFLPGERMPTVSFWEFLAFDKVAHAAVYCVFVFLMIVGFCKQYSYPTLRYYPNRYAILICIVYGGMVEVMQGTFLPDRYFDLLDISANVVGIFGGVGLFHLVYFKL